MADGTAGEAAHARLTALFSEAIELDREARAALVERVRATDAALASELLGLLAADAVAAAHLHTGALARDGGAEARDAGAAASDPERDPATPGPRAVSGVDATVVDGANRAVGTSPTERDRAPIRAEPPRLSIPGYRVEGLLGEGGMGAVYAGEQESPPRPVAIKVLHASSGPALARFWTEAAIMARLDHPGIARVLESGEAGGHPYIVMERVEGTTLDVHVRDAPVRRRLELFAAVCDAVHHAHLNGVIHRDLKPANVMVRDDGRIAVLDFGIARASALSGSSSGATRAGELIGTPVYMSPEQARLRPDEVDARSDVYSLGVTLHELVAGDLPYDVRDLPLIAVSHIICEEPPRSLRALGHDRDLAAIAAAALAKDPRDRYQSAAALAEDIRRYLEGRAVSVRTPGTLERLRRFARRRPAVAAAIAGAVIAAIAFTVVVTQLWWSARRAEQVASDARGRAETALAALAARTADLTLQQARALLSRDPTAAIALVEELRASGAAVDGGAWALDAIAEEARARGAATEVLRGHRDEVHWIEPVAGALASAGYDGTARWWRAPFRESVVALQTGARLHVARPSPDGRLAVAGDAGLLRVVGEDGVVELAGHRDAIEQVAWSPDGAWLISGDGKGVLIAWPRAAAPGRRLDGPTSEIDAIVFVAGAVIVGDHDGVVWRWDLASWARTRLETGGGTVRAVWAEGDRIAVATQDGGVRRWRAVDTAPVADGEVRTQVPAKRAAFAAGGTVAVIAGIDGTIVRVEGTSVEIVGTHATKVRGLAVSDDGRRIATGSEDGLIRVWDRATGRRVVLRGHGQRIRQLAFAGRTLWSSDGEGAIRRWDLDGQPATLLEAHVAAIEHVAVAGDGRAAVSADESGVVVVSDLRTGAIRTAGRTAAHVTAVAVGAEAITGDVDAVVTWWRETGPVRRPVPGAVRAIAVSPETIAVATAAGAIALFDRAGAPRATLAGHPGGTDTLAFDRGGLLASGGQDRAVRVWRMPDGAPVATLDGQTSDTSIVRFSPSGDRLAAACDDGTVRVWTVVGGAIASGPWVAGRHEGAVGALAFDPTGRFLATAGRDVLVQRADLTTGRLAAVQGRSRGAHAIAVDAAGRVIVAREGATVERWAAAAPAAIPLTATTTAGAALPDGGIVVGGIDGTLRVIGAPR